MKFLTLTLENFRGIKGMEIDFQGKDCCIFGQNASGKSTIANAVCWLLTGSPMTGEKDFSPKTAGSHNLHHKAELTIQQDDGSIIRLAKDFYEKWSKRKGAATAELTGHTTDFAIDGVPYKEKDYIKAVEELCGGDMDKVKLMSILGYFSESMKADDRRQILFDVCGDVTDQEIMDSCEELSDLKGYLLVQGTTDKYHTIEEYRAMASKQRTKLKKDLDMLPERIDEQNNSLPEGKVDEKALEDKLAELQQLRDSILNDSKAEVKRICIKALKEEMTAKKAAYIKAQSKVNEAANEVINKLMLERQSLGEQLSKLTFDIMGKQQKKEQLSTQRQSLLDEWQQVAAMQWDDNEAICPCCGQELPAEQVESKKAAFLAHLHERKAQIREQGKTCSDAVIQQMAAEIELNQKQSDDINAEMVRLASLIKEQQSKLLAPEPYENTKEYKEAAEKLAGFEAEKAALDTDTAQLDDIDVQIKMIRSELATVAMTAKIKARIAELEELQRSTAAKLESVERGLWLCDEFTRRKVAAVTDKINSRFKTVEFQLFKDQINGGLKECCEALIPSPDGVLVEYKSANTAAKANAGLEIISVLSKHYGMKLPIIMDGAESVCQPADTEQQLIRLIVSAADKDIRIKTM